MLKWYGFLGLLLIALAEINFVTVIQPFASWYIVIVWYGFILFIDSLVYAAKGKSLISSHANEFVFILLLSVPFWLIFEFYNLFTHSWYYINYLYYVHLFDFTTILPALLEVFSLITALGVGSSFDSKMPRKTVGTSRRHSGNAVIAILAAIGFVLALLPIALGPAGFLFMWIGIALFLDPLNCLLGKPSLLLKAADGKKSTLINLSIAGLIMGFFWEFWNYQAYPKWVYNLPSFIINVKLFAMPLEGYVGYVAFAVSAYLFYAFFRGFVFRKRNELLDM